MIYRFGAYSIDPRSLELSRGGAVVAVEPQVFSLLLYLIENRDRVVSKDDLIADVWGGRIVSDATLSSRISSARHAVGDSGEAQQVIRTIRSRGFRFVADVKTEEPDEITPASEVSPPPRKPTLAVLPFANMSGDPDQDYFCDGMTDEIITALSKIADMFVIARSSVFTYKGRAVKV